MRYDIWKESIPYNSTRKKELDLPGVRENVTIMDFVNLQLNGESDKNDPAMDMSIINSIKYQEIQSGQVLSTYEDIPYIESYMVEGSDKSVLVAPGGAYLMVSMVNEGLQIAEYFNQRGINVFVLHYRVYPYANPVPFVDCQRAIRYLTYHSTELGIDPNKINLLGFSAGGNLVATTMHFFADANDFPEDYVMDEIDKVQIKINSIGLIYPKLMFTNESRLLTPLFGEDIVRAKEQREKLVEKYSLNTKITHLHPSTFLCNATDDSLISNEDLLTYASELDKHKVSFELHMFKKGGHGFGACKEIDPAQPDRWKETKEWMNLYCNWLLALLSIEKV